MDDTDRLFMSLLGFAVPTTAPKCSGPVVVWKDADLLVKRCAHGTTEVALRELGPGEVPGPMRRMSGMN